MYRAQYQYSCIHSIGFLDMGFSSNCSFFSYGPMFLKIHKFVASVAVIPCEVSRRLFEEFKSYPPPKVVPFDPYFGHKSVKRNQLFPKF